MSTRKIEACVPQPWTKAKNYKKLGVPIVSLPETRPETGGHYVPVWAVIIVDEIMPDIASMSGTQVKKMKG